MKPVIDVLRQWLSTFPKKEKLKLVVAYSGGLDSHVLLHALVQLRCEFEFDLRAIHVNHNLQSIAKDWPKHCQSICHLYDVTLTCLSLNLTLKKGKSVEEMARVARYNALTQALHQHEILLTAHHALDQAETFLLQLMRGSGMQGLSAIAPQKKLKNNELYRPLLTVEKSEMENYAKEHQLEWIEDPTNQSLDLRRNFMRHKVLPLLKTQNPSVVKCISRAATHQQQAHFLLDELLSPLLEKAMGPISTLLSLDDLKTHSSSLQIAILRKWFEKNNIYSPSSVKLNELLNQCLNANRDANLSIIWGDWQIKRYQQFIYLLPNVSLIYEPMKWDLQNSIQIGPQQWQAQKKLGKGISCQKIGEQLSIKFRVGGERCKIAGNLHHQLLKKILQTKNIPPWERHHTPLFYKENNLVGVGQNIICQDWQALSDEWGWCIEVKPVG